MEDPTNDQIYLEMCPYKHTESFYQRNIPFPLSDVKIVKVKKGDVIPSGTREFDVKKFRKCFPMPLGDNQLLLGGYLHNIK